MAEKLAKTNVISEAEYSNPAVLEPAEELRLCRAAVGEPLEVVHIYGDEKLRGKLMALGIVPGATMSLARGGDGKPVVVALAGSRLILDGASAGAVGVIKRGRGAGGAGPHRHRRRRGRGQP